jgi:superfamily II DNA/RNA helicase
VISMASFAALRVQSHIVARLAKSHIVSPTAVQRMALEKLMPRTQGHRGRLARGPRHALIRWSTGSGKTLAYALPMVAGLEIAELGRGVQALVVTPTRELCLQTMRTLNRITGGGKANKKGHKIKVQGLMGRRTLRVENELRKNPPDVAVGTPHTLRSLLEDGKLPLCPTPTARTIVLDEIGVLMQDFSWPVVKRVLAAGSTSDRSPWSTGGVWIVSADVPAGAMELTLRAAKATSTPEPPTAIMQEERMPPTVRHVALWPAPPLVPSLHELVDTIGHSRRGGRLDRDSQTTPSSERAAAGSPDDSDRAEQGLTGAAPQHPKGARSRARALVFVESSSAAERLRRDMRNRRVSSAAVHNATTEAEGEKGTHSHRNWKLRAFSEGKVRVLAATEMLAIGVDIRGATHVVNATVPATVTSYLHRAGRVGRTGGAAGTVISLPRDEQELNRLRQFSEELGFPLELHPTLQAANSDAHSLQDQEQVERPSAQIV